MFLTLDHWVKNKPKRQRKTGTLPLPSCLWSKKWLDYIYAGEYCLRGCCACWWITFNLLFSSLWSLSGHFTLCKPHLRIRNKEGIVPFWYKRILESRISYKLLKLNLTASESYPIIFHFICLRDRLHTNMGGDGIPKTVPKNESFFCYLTKHKAGFIYERNL